MRKAITLEGTGGSESEEERWGGTYGSGVGEKDLLSQGFLN